MKKSADSKKPSTPAPVPTASTKAAKAPKPAKESVPPETPAATEPPAVMPSVPTQGESQPPAQAAHVRMPKKLIVSLVLLAVASGALSTWFTYTVLQGWHSAEQTTPASGNFAKDDGNRVSSAEENRVAAAAEKVSPSVVSIAAQSRNARTRQATQGAGTGIIVSHNGYIVTNKHVVDGASLFEVTTSDGTIYDDVHLVGTDPLNDVAFLKVNNAAKLTPAEIGNSQTARIGQNVVAIGNSLGEYQNTVTSGIISGLGRPVNAQAQDESKMESLTGLIQTDSAINPGNSGGPLINLSGQVIGINTAVVADAQGIGFAIPINSVKGILKGVLAKGKVMRPYLGVHYVEITPALARSRRLPVKTGALVTPGRNQPAVESNGPAQKAGIKEGDIITKIGDSEVKASQSVSSLVSQYQPGERVRVSVLRDGKEQTMEVTLAQYTGGSQFGQEQRRQQSQQDHDDESSEEDSAWGF